MPLTDAETFLSQLDQILAPLPEANRELMKGWAAREMVMTPVITRTTCRVWVDAYADKEGQHPAGFRTLTWNMGKASPQNPEALIFAMLSVDTDHVHVFSFVPVQTDGQEAMLYFREVLYKPEMTFGPMGGEALFEEFCNLLATDEEKEEVAKAEEKAAGGKGTSARANGAAS
jgi:hypothetical protein